MNRSDPRWSTRQIALLALLSGNLMTSSMQAAQDALLSRVGGYELVGWHRQHGLNLDGNHYLELYRRQLSRGLLECSRVFLDTNYWAHLREAQRGSGSREATDLLVRLRELVRSRQVICVGHLSTVLELAKQTAESLKVTSRLFDELTEGVVVAAPAELRFFELIEFMATKSGQPAPIETSCWSVVGQFLKSDIPERMPGPCSDSDRRVVQKCAIDTAWNTRLEDLFAQLDWQTKEKLNGDIEADVVQQVEALKAARKAEPRSPQRARIEEFSALLQGSYLNEFVDHLILLGARNGKAINRDAANRSARVALAAAIRDFKSDSLGTMLPNAVLTTELYLLYERASMGRTLTTNDWQDWQHAAAGLRYCDYFFTERHLANQLTNVLRADIRYCCRVEDSIAGALSALAAPRREKGLPGAPRASIQSAAP